MKIREGMIPTILGTVVTAAGLSLKPFSSRISWGITGFGLAHILKTYNIYQNIIYNRQGNSIPLSILYIHIHNVLTTKRQTTVAYITDRYRSITINFS